MRLVLVLFVALLSIVGGDAHARREFPSQTQRAGGPRVDRITITEKGIFRAKIRSQKQDINSPTGGVRPLATITLIKNTETFVPNAGMHFGIRYMIRGFPRGAKVPIKVVQRYPIAGLKNPRTGKTTYSYQQTSFKTIGYPAFEGYHLGAAWELVPGIWSFEIWYGGRLLAEQKFELITQ